MFFATLDRHHFVINDGADHGAIVGAVMLTGVKYFSFIHIGICLHNKKLKNCFRLSKPKNGIRKKAIIDTVITGARNAGIILLTIPRKGCSLKANAAKRFIPIGGVINSTDSAVTTNTPKCNGSNPSSCPIGNNIGITLTIQEHGLDCRNAFSKVCLPELDGVKQRKPIPIEDIRQIQKDCISYDDEDQWLVYCWCWTGL